MKRVLFVCTGNIYRSLTAQKVFEKHLKESGVSDWKVSSAGTVASKAEIRPELANALKDVGVTNLKHKQRKVSKRILNDHDVVVCMAQDHVDFLVKNFDYRDAKLFNELANEEETSVLDIDGCLFENKSKVPSLIKEIEKTVGHIEKSTPKLLQNLQDRYFLFTDFISGKRKHRNGFPFITLFETKNSVAFMSIDIPKSGDGHFLVIPKKRYVDFYKIPKYILNEMFATMSVVGKVLNETHDGFNILLNNGAQAGQYIFHSHFHLLPRKRGDGIQIELWKKDKISKEDFFKINEDFKKLINRKSK